VFARAQRFTEKSFEWPAEHESLVIRYGGTRGTA